MKFTGRQPAGTKCRNTCRSPGKSLNSVAVMDHLPNNAFARITDPRGARIGDEGKLLSLGQAVEDLFLAGGFIEFMITQEGLLDVILLEQGP